MCCECWSSACASFWINSTAGRVEREGRLREGGRVGRGGEGWEREGGRVGRGREGG